MNESAGSERGVAEAVTELLATRKRLESFLQKLLELRDETSPSVYERVRSDYVGRLGVVDEQLAEHREALETILGPRRQAVTELKNERTVAAMALEEAQLRYRAGEHDEPEWESRREAGEAAVEALDEVLEQERGRLAALEALLGELQAVGPRSVPAAEPSPEPREQAPSLVKSWIAGGRSGLAAASDPGIGTPGRGA